MAASNNRQSGKEVLPLRDRELSLCARAMVVGEVSNDFARCFDHLTSNGRQDLVFALPISFCSIIRTGKPLSGEWGMNMTVAVVLFALLCILTISFIKVGQELKRDLPRQE
jgi:hypothetical protein